MQSSTVILRDLSQQNNRSQKSHSQNSTHYDILQVSETATFDVIRNAYMQQIKMYRNDVNDAVSHYQAVIVAYRILKNPETRQAYDTRLAATRAKARESMKKLVDTLSGMMDDLSSLDCHETPVANHNNPLAFLCASVGLSYTIIAMSAIAAVFYPASMLGTWLGLIGFLGSCGSCYKMFRHFKQENAHWEKNFLEPAKTLLRHHQHVENIIAFHRECIPKLTYKSQQTETICSTSTEGLSEECELIRYHLPIQ